MTKREYAISLGLAKPGRGRLSREAHAAIAQAESEGMVFSDGVKPATGGLIAANDTPIIVEGCVVEPAKVLPPQEKQRDITVYTLTTKAGQIINFGHCSRCRETIMYCACKHGPYYPKWINDEVETWTPSDLVVG